MTPRNASKTGIWLVCLAFLLGSCAPAASNDSIIATSVAQTVAVQDTMRAAVAATVGVVTPSLTALTPPTPLSTKAPPTAPTGSQYCTASAAFVSDVTIPDGTIIAPGQVFTKRWSIKNTGTCPWTKLWKLVYVSGDLMGAGTVYDFPQPVSPGQTAEVPLVLTGPLTAGSYRGYWKIQSPWGYIFGDEGSGNAFWVDVVVGSGTPLNNKTQTVYDITSVSYTITKRCTTANTFWHIIVNLTSNGPIKVKFDIRQSDGNGQNSIRMEFTGAGTQSYDYGEWSQRFTSSPNPRWVQVIEETPVYREWPISDLMYLC